MLLGIALWDVMTRVAGQYDYTLTLLLLPEAEWQGARHDAP
jgi:hypothetical protein